MRASVETAVFTHRSFAIVCVSGKEQQELAMCWRCDRVSKTHGSAIVIDTRTEGSKGLDHRSIRLLFRVYALGVVCSLAHASSLKHAILEAHVGSVAELRSAYFARA